MSQRAFIQDKELGIRLVRIKESEKTWDDTADDIFYVNKGMKDDEISAFLYFLFGKVFVHDKYRFHSDNPLEAYLNRHYGFPTDFDISRDRENILEYLVDVNDSFGSKYPKLAKLWSEGDNGKLTPFMFLPGSNFDPVWRCPECGAKWRSPIASIVARKVRSCKACSMKANGATITKVKTEKYGCLAERSEELLRQWDYERNGNLSPYEIPLNYSFEVAWKCDVCGYKWEESPNSRVRRDKVAKCPHCTGRVAMQGVDDLETMNEEIAKEWDYERNVGIRPSDIRPHSNTPFYWICPKCGRSYPAKPAHRVDGHGCPDCAHARVGLKNSKLVGQYLEDGTLVTTFNGLHEAARAMNVVPNSIFQAVKNGKKSKGYYWKYIK